MLPRIPYIEWITGRPAAADHDLGSSDLRRAPPSSNVVPPVLSDRGDPPEDVTLRSQIAAIYGVPPESVLVTAGATHANLVAAATALAAATESRTKTNGATGTTGTNEAPAVLVENPGYQPLVRTPRGLGARVDRFSRSADERYRLSPDSVADAFPDRLALVTVTNRHNPSGRLTTRETLASLADRVADAGAYLLVDEVYAPFVSASEAGSTPGSGPRPFGGVSAAGLPNTVVTGSLTKFYGLGGLTVGWLVGPQSFVERARRVLTHVPFVATPTAALARRALHHEADLTARSRDHLASNHDRLTAFVDGRSDLAGDVPEDSSYAFLSHESADGDAVSEAAWDAGILVVPGRFFDDASSFRLSLGRAPDEVDAGLDALGAVLDDL
ncbi:pyridoxal phosphate-dependent aminotransferase [Haloprofundus halobius]|uniref:pyridoxal phosphate-dependent aminotransferase n=1 Tax=Haloprofundus halobius TaxID=2876194 RepID=UPI001CCB927C|nr:pyridoxal phosphate-dependent aminotransferase [Haloprofundus halobius]